MGETRMKDEAWRATFLRDSLEGGVTRNLRIYCLMVTGLGELDT